MAFWHDFHFLIFFFSTRMTEWRIKNARKTVIMTIPMTMTNNINDNDVHVHVYVFADDDDGDNNAFKEMMSL